MEYKYLLIIASIGVISMMSIMIAKNNQDSIILDPVTSFYNIDANSIFGEVINMKAYKGNKSANLNFLSEIIGKNNNSSSTSSSNTSSSTNKKDISSKLKELKSMLDEGLISQEQYDDKSTKILDEF